MNEKQQRRFFFPLWTQTCRALGWKMAANRLVMPAKPSGNPHVIKVVAAAERIALGQRRAMNIDDLRHGCYVVALGRDRDTMKLNNHELDAVTSLFKLLADETNIAADMRLSDPDIGERERLVRAIIKLKVPDALIDEICRRSFAPVYSAPFYEDLPLLNLRALVGILTEIKIRKHTSPRPSPQSGEGELFPASVEYPY